MEPMDPLYAEWLAQQGAQGTSYAQPRPFPTPPPAPQPLNAYAGGTAPQTASPTPPAVGTAPAPGPGRMTPQNPTGGLPRQIQAPRNADLFGTYNSVYQAGRQMGQPPAQAQPGQPGWGQPAQQPTEQPFYLDNMGNTQPGGMMQPQDPRDAYMAKYFPRSTELGQNMARMKMHQERAAIAAATPPPPGPAGPAGQPGKMGPRGPMGPARPPLKVQ